MTSCLDCTLKKNYDGEIVCRRFLKKGTKAYYGCDCHDEYCAEGIAGFTYDDCRDCDNDLCELRITEEES